MKVIGMRRLCFPFFAQTANVVSTVIVEDILYPTLY